MKNIYFREISAVGLIYKKGYLKGLYLAPCYLIFLLTTSTTMTLSKSA
jgi:hypothetical protein